MIRNSKSINLEAFLGYREVKEKFNNYFKMSFLGTGQGGSKIVSQFVKLGYYSSLCNTCKEDLIAVENTLKKDNVSNYSIIKLPGFEGAAKDKKIGLKAITTNKELVEEQIINDDSLIDTDFTFLSGALGGGTGCGSVNVLGQIIGMTKARAGKLYKGKPTVGLILAFPEKFTSHIQRVNAYQTLLEIVKLQEQNRIGCCILVDNDTIIDAYVKDNKKYKDWTELCNTTIASIITEFTSTVNISSESNYDKTELLDGLTTPGFALLGKSKINNISDISDFGQFFQEMFYDTNLYAKDYDFCSTVHGSMIMLVPKNNENFTMKDSLTLQLEFKKFLDNSLVKKTHIGVYENSLFGTYNNPNKNDSKQKPAIIYSFLVLKSLPGKILDIKKEITEEKIKKTELKNNSMNINEELLKDLNDDLFNDEEDEIENSPFGNANMEDFFKDTSDTPIMPSYYDNDEKNTSDNIGEEIMKSVYNR